MSHSHLSPAPMMTLGRYLSFQPQLMKTPERGSPQIRELFPPPASAPDQYIPLVLTSLFMSPSVFSLQR
jgi:hypothetical protein